MGVLHRLVFLFYSHPSDPDDRNLMSTTHATTASSRPTSALPAAFTGLAAALVVLQTLLLLGSVTPGVRELLFTLVPVAIALALLSALLAWKRRVWPQGRSWLLAVTAMLVAAGAVFGWVTLPAARLFGG